MASIKKAYRDANNLYHSGEKTKALAKVKECRDGFTKVKNELNKIEDTMMGDVCGFLLAGGLLELFFDIKAGGIKGAAEWGKSYLLRLVLSLVGTPLGLGSVMNLMGISIKLMLNQQKGVGTSNVTKSQMIAAIDENIKMCNKLEEAIKKSKD